MLDSSIPMQGRGVNLQQAIGNYNTSRDARQKEEMQRANLQDMAQQRQVRAEQLRGIGLQNTEDARKSHEEQTLRGVFQVNNGGQTLQDQSQILKDTTALGLGNRVMELSSAFKKQKYDSDRAIVETDIDHHKWLANNLPYINSQQDLDFLVRRSNVEYLKEVGLPGQYDQGRFDEFKNQMPATKSMLDKQKIDIENAYKTGELTQKQNELALNRDKLKEEARNNNQKDFIDREKNAIDRSKVALDTTKANENKTTNAEIQIPGLSPIDGVNITKESVRIVKNGAQAYDEVKRQVSGLRDLYGQYGTELTGNAARRFASKVIQIQLTLKGPEFLQLGVLAGPDMVLLNEMVPNPAGFSENVKSIIPGIGDPINPKLDELETFIEERFNSALLRNGFKRNNNSPPPSNTVPSNNKFTTPNEEAEYQTLIKSGAKFTTPNEEAEYQALIKSGAK